MHPFIPLAADHAKFELSYEAAIPYVSNGAVAPDTEHRLRALIFSVKRAGPYVTRDGVRYAKGVDFAAEIIAANVHLFPNTLGGSRWLVPVPPHDASLNTWGADDLAQALAGRGLGTYKRALVRTLSVLSSREERAAKRQAPSIHEHLASIALLGTSLAGLVTLVDDVVTTGCTAMACSQKFPDAASVQLFALGHTSDRSAAIEVAKDVIKWGGKGGKTFRERK